MDCLSIGKQRWLFSLVLNYTTKYDTNHISQIVDDYLDFAIEKRLRQLVARKEVEPSPETLKISHITGPLIILGIGEICALLAFIGEHLWIRFQGKQ